LAKQRKKYTELHEKDRGNVGSNQKFFIFIDQKKIMELIPRLQKQRLFDTNLSRAEIEFYQPLLAAFASISYATKIIKTYYVRNSSADKVYVAAYLLGTDLYGNTAVLNLTLFLQNKVNCE